MNREEEIKRRIELNRQFIILTEQEIKALESLLAKAATLIGEKADVTSPAALNP
jgi:phosphohistidine swiveling domain-containing protein